MSGEMIGSLLQDLLWSGITAAGFGVLFNVPVRLLLACAICGACGRATRDLLMGGGVQIEAATLAGSVVVGMLGELCARRFHAPALVFTVSGAIPMVPGVIAYRAMIGLINVSQADATTANAVILDALINLVKTGLILGALAAGIAAPTLLFRRRKPVV